jgi:hypothetical protein
MVEISFAVRPGGPPVQLGVPQRVLHRNIVLHQGGAARQ